MKHRFFALEDSIMIEIANITTTSWNINGEIDPNDIERESQGGRIINGKEFTLDEMKKEGLLDL